MEKRTTDFFELVATGTPIQVQEAIKAGADLKAQAKYGRTPLMAAARYNQNPKVITVLLAAGADVNALDIYGRDPADVRRRVQPEPRCDHHAAESWRGCEGEKTTRER